MSYQESQQSVEHLTLENEGLKFSLHTQKRRNEELVAANSNGSHVASESLEYEEAAQASLQRLGGGAPI